MKNEVPKDDNDDAKLTTNVPMSCCSNCKHHINKRFHDNSLFKALCSHLPRLRAPHTYSQHHNSQV